MNANAVFNTVVASAGIPKSHISRNLGKSTNYIGVMITNANVPKVDTFAKIADSCGWDLLARNRTTGEEIVIDPE